MFGLVIGFIDLMRIVTTNDCNAIASSHTLQFISVCTKSPQSVVCSPIVAR
jgi:hypothetical protein